MIIYPTETVGINGVIIMLNQFSRTQLVFGKNAMEILRESTVAVFGIGGVGGYTVEALARSGVGRIDIIDDDKICLTNINRQILATRETVGKYKVDVAEERIRAINPDCDVRKYRTFYMPDAKDEFDFTEYDYIVDAIDTVKGKLELVMNAKAAGVPIICSMGAGNKVDASAFEVADIYDTSAQGCLLKGKADSSDRGYVNQLQKALYLSARYRAKMYRAKGYPGFNGVCAVGCRLDNCGRGNQGFDKF